MQLSGQDVEEGQTPCLDRRGFLKLAACALGAVAASPALGRTVGNKDRMLSLYSPRTGETVRTVYWAPRIGYIGESLKEVSWALRDHRNDQYKLFDPKLLDQLYALQRLMDPRQPMHIISGYRSPATNAMLRQHNRRVAKNSYHIRAMATDIRMPGHSTKKLHRAALSLNGGGVGYYSRSDFVHIDTGPVRTWG
jgi:uncharacterized protein YcbK (DUF882 family)